MYSVKVWLTSVYSYHTWIINYHFDSSPDSLPLRINIAAAINQQRQGSSSHTFTFLKEVSPNWQKLASNMQKNDGSILFFCTLEFISIHLILPGVCYLRIQLFGMTNWLVSLLFIEVSQFLSPAVFPVVSSPDSWIILM